MRSFLCLLLLLFFVRSFSENNCSFIKSIDVQSDVMYNGAHGMKINYQTNFDSLIIAINNDSIILKSDFNISFSFETSAGKIIPAEGFGRFKNTENSLIYSQKVIHNKKLNSKQDNVFFVPYASFNVKEGEQVINIILNLTGKDGNGKEYTQLVEKSNIIIHKKAQYKVTFNIDYVEAAERNAKGRVWDFSPLGYNIEPDVGVSFQVGGFIIWKKSVENNTVFVIGKSAKNISFIISQGDEFNVNVIDVDLLFDDFIGGYKIKPTATNLNTPYSINTINGKIVSCNMSCSIE